MKCEKYMSMLVTKRQVSDVNTGHFKKSYNALSWNSEPRPVTEHFMEFHLKSAL